MTEPQPEPMPSQEADASHDLPPKKPSTLAQSMRFGVMASEAMFCVAGGLLGGAYLDRRWDTSPLCVALGLLLGSVIGFTLLLRLLKQMEAERER